MKKSFLALATLCVASVYGQTNEGNWVLNARTSLNFNQVTRKLDNGLNTLNNHRISNTNLAISGGYFIANNFALGTTFEYARTMTEESNGDELTNSRLAFVPSALAYINLGNSNFKPFLSAGLGYGRSNTKYVNYTSKESEQKQENGGLLWVLGGGVSYFVSERLSVSFDYRYTCFGYKVQDVKVREKGPGLGLGIGLHF
ncbi:hypothetical protein EDM00_05135 [Ornithobacterium rhinotracheale]|uniref:outer membrane beta-barrel protein n=1 Tax=Ornithobacterium rhinotracheale TaxID=28251 RepID=UPI00129D0DAE|nr:outer membrane beta-barrel protein [Ornithobacterium rhinotracheale]MRI63372.1 hypothetical protein [Ornithobacterium rhinotracheale]MRJ10553.1 hypothetical protein [Ornithobacterium rhinotracheale]